ncbi:hypothetical protein PRIPAC_85705 [Pristionchus pacificus]|uniref:Uncharacterized protein n=1 Tax=Pristionchus pacificus TaxID=54126 RepID=H3FDM0_PRIPA|nr:hypothetical protein PRIPAC_94726 [Pristionchus pacificus]KAF8367876.1 hypothetical protein PRIPAC_85705 [Pristionchus pacificus]|eukprot:PDM68825.1 hypothetical protein PRIPAC_47127 [Pristionchus pacificus]
MVETPKGPTKSALPPEARAPVRYASQESVDALSGKVDKMMRILTKIVTILETPSPTPPPSLPALSPVVNMAREVYEACTKAVMDKNEYADKETRAVVIGSTESKVPAESLKKDEELVASLIDYSESEAAKKALADGKVTHHRHPIDRPAHKRPLKIKFESKDIRDSFLKGIRSKKGRPPPLVSPSSFVRIDLTPTQLALEREARQEAVKKNLEAGHLLYGVRDFSLITYKHPRALPPNYGTPRESRYLSAADIPSTDASSSGAPSTTASTASSSAPAPSTKTTNVTVRGGRDKQPPQQPAT